MRATIATPEEGAPDVAVIEVFDAPPLGGEPSFTILSTQGYLSPDGWRESETPLTPEAWERDGDRLRLAVAADIMDQLDPRETYRFGLGDQVCVLRAGGNPPAGETRHSEPRPVPQDTETLSMTPPGSPPETPDPLPLPEEEPRRGRRPPLLLLLALLIAGGAFLNRPTPHDTPPATADPAVPAVIQEAAPPASGTEATPPAAETAETAAAGTTAISSARDLLRRNAPPEETLAAGKALRAPAAGGQQSDAAFLLLEDAAQKGSAEAMFLVGSFYDPASELPRGSIPPDLAQARYWYEAARDKGYAEGARALSALRDLTVQKARRGDGEARLLLQSWK